jgi:hypothetical protein
MPVKVPVIKTTGLLIFRFLIQFSLPAKARIVPLDAVFDRNDVHTVRPLRWLLARR